MALTFSVGLFSLFLVPASIASIQQVGEIGLIGYSVFWAMTLAFYVLVFINPILLNSTIYYWFEGFCVVMVGTQHHLLYLFAASHVPNQGFPVNAPLLSVLCPSIPLALYATKSKLLVRQFVYLALGFLPLYFTYNQYFSKAFATQAMVVCALIALSIWLHDVFKSQFYITSSQVIEKIRLGTGINNITYPHVSHLLLKGYRIQEVMPCSNGEGYVLVFDLIGSSRETMEFVDQEMKKLFSAILRRKLDTFSFTENYVNGNVRGEIEVYSDYFFIKHTGDGFILSVNFPFKFYSDNGLSLPDYCVCLGIELEEMYRTHCKALSRNTPCSIGIAHGSLGSSFIEAEAEGFTLFDCYGDAIKHASRIEATRKAFTDQASILTISSQLYDNCSENVKDGFQARPVQVRDYERENVVFVQFL